MLKFKEFNKDGTLFKLRQHQVELRPAVYKVFKDDKNAVPLAVVPTGGGKSLSIAGFVIDAYNHKRSVLIITHSQELVGQNAKELQDNVNKRINVGICSSGHGKFDTTSSIIFAGIQTIVNRLDECRAFDLVIIDECHRISLDQMTQYQQLLEKLLEKNPNTRTLGLTATPYRMGQGFLTEPWRDSKTKQPRDSFFTTIAYEAYIVDLMERGELCKVKTVESSMDVRLPDEESLDNNWSFIFDSAAKEFLEFSKIHKRRRTLIFVANTDQCIYIKKLLKDSEVTAKILSSTYKEDMGRKQLLEWFAENTADHRAIINIGILTTGFDQRDIDCGVMLLSTKSVNKYVQIVGRLLRVHPSKDYALLLDYGKHVERLGAIDNLKVRQAGNGEMILKFCPVDAGGCGEQNFPSAKTCWNCGHKFVSALDLQKFEQKASKLAVVQAYSEQQLEPEKFECNYYVFIGNYGKNGKPDSLRVAYYYDSKQIAREWFYIKSKKPGFGESSINKLSKYFKNKNDFWNLVNDVEYNLFNMDVDSIADFFNKEKEYSLIEIKNVVVKKVYKKDRKEPFDEIIAINS